MQPFFRLFSGLNQLIEVNECEYLCNKQQKIDSQQYLMMNLSLSMNVILRKDKTKIDLAAYHHASIFSPVQSTLVYVIKNNYFTSWPGLSQKLITKNLPTVLATAKGHLNQEKKNFQSTKSIPAYGDQLKKIRANIKKIKQTYHQGNLFELH